MGKDVVDFNHDDVTPTNTGQSILVIDLKAFGDPIFFKAAVAKLVDDIHNSQRLPGVDKIWLPGEQSELRRKTYAESGIPLGANLLSDLDALAAELGISPLKSLG
jgi:LDH2 family malate/lactate/ureidoglycolate dehydrogenase